MPNTTPPEPAAAVPAQAMALEALQAWARNRDRMPDDRATLVALAWRTGARNIRELARLADVSRDTIYADLRARGIDAGDRTAAATTPKYQPLTAAAIAGLGRLVQTRALPSLIGADRQPLAEAVWALGIALDRIEHLLEHPHGTDDTAGEAGIGSRAQVLQDIVDRAATVIDEAQGLLTEEFAGFTDAQLAARTEEAEIAALDGGQRPVVERAELQLALPNDEAPAVTMTLYRPSGGLLAVSSDSPLVAGQLDRRGHVALTAAFDVIARALEAVLTDDAYLDDTINKGDHRD
ncbi:hypothetical protein QRX50_36130 [Amycolatopsis carbonis]|uniref:Uncharacterized protein n=1 Tax=Amycolatopsis carbonis TaxID=715471 RepID=A0A9Y2ID64_9PSEU|nr:hypothetical protein [Amycolatopsis sp. 2-15]WIX76821.1 hypothetical protein QRX50_36130 [Amycolatopsis sp. 2-15]